MTGYRLTRFIWLASPRYICMLRSLPSSIPATSSTSISPLRKASHPVKRTDARRMAFFSFLLCVKNINFLHTPSLQVKVGVLFFNISGKKGSIVKKHFRNWRGVTIEHTGHSFGDDFYTRINGEKITGPKFCN